MNERDRDWRQAREKKDPENAAALAEIGITPAEASLFYVIYLGFTVPPSDLCRRATGRDYTVGGPLTVEENRAALAGCLSKGWLQIIDEATQLYRTVSAEIFGQGWEEGISVEDTYFREEHRYCTTQAVLAAIIEDYMESGETPTSIRTLPIGPWCVNWWHRFRSGYRLELTFGKP